MKIQSNNKLAHYQIEYNELCEQQIALQNQLSMVNNQIVQMQQYLSVNCGDKFAARQYRELQKQYRTLYSRVQKTNNRLVVVQRQIANEAMRSQMRCSGASGYRTGYRSKRGSCM